VFPWLRKNAGETFFAWIHYFDPHDRQIMPPEAIRAKFRRASPEEDRPEYARSLYDAEIYFTDLHIGEIVHELKRLGIRNRTVLIITADHGQSLGDHDIWGHGFLYQEQIKVPLVMNGPGIPQGVVISSLVEHVDIFPTLLDLAKPGMSEKLGALQGKSLLPYFQGERLPDKNRVAYSEVPVPRTALQVGGGMESQKGVTSEDDHGRAVEEAIKKPKQGHIYCLIKDDWKFFHFPDDPRLDRLYNLRSDPEEQDNVIAAKRDVASELLKELERREAIHLQIPEEHSLSKDDIEHLRALGYLDDSEVPSHVSSKKNNREEQDEKQINDE
jgi:arylsulfatase A-like enzyme